MNSAEIIIWRNSVAVNIFLKTFAFLAADDVTIWALKLMFIKIFILLKPKNLWAEVGDECCLPVDVIFS